MPIRENDRWGSIVAFEAVGRRLSLVSAADELALSASALSRRIANLEQRLGVRLLQRTTRQMQLTEIGEAYLRRCQALIEQVEQMDAIASDTRSEPAGTLRISLPTLYGQLEVAPRLPRFMERYPKIRMQVLLSDAYIDMVAQRIDVAVRIGDLKDSDYVARRLAPNTRYLCASPGYLARCGAPAAPEELVDHSCLHFSPLADGRRWRLVQAGRRAVEVSINPVLTADNAELLRQAALTGRGIALLADFIVRDDIAAGRLVPVLTRWPPADSGIHVVYPAGRHLPARTRAFIDFMIEASARQG